MSIIQEIEDYVSKYGGYFSSWYIGIAEDPEDRLFNQHNVNKKNDNWIYRPTSSSATARNIEQYFLGLGMDGGSGGGDYLSKAVYCYKKTYLTNPWVLWKLRNNQYMRINYFGGQNMPGVFCPPK